MLNMDLVDKQLECNQEIKRVLSSIDCDEKFNLLLQFKNKVPVELYAFYLRAAYQMNIRNAPLDILIEAFDGVDKNLIMYQSEIDKFNQLSAIITIYRGTDITEEVPRLSWSLEKCVANKFAQGRRLFKTEIDKNKIYAYFCENGDEEEIVVNTIDDFEIYY